MTAVLSAVASSNPLQSWAGTAASLTAVGAALSLFGRWVAKWAGRIQRVVEVVEERTQELTPGTGAGGLRPSLRDDVAQVLTRLDEFEKITASLSQQLADLNGALQSDGCPQGEDHPCGCDARPHTEVHPHVPHPLPRAWSEGV